MSLLNDLFGISPSEDYEKNLPGTETKLVKFIMKDGSERQGILQTNPMWPGVRQCRFCGGHPESNTYVDMDLVKEVVEVK
jgi:hypothetical protein